jgi:hypothetical protein
MRQRNGRYGILAATLILALGAPALAQTGADDHAAHHPEEQATVPENDAPAPESGVAQMPGMMGMMTPEMMQMMMRMMGEGGMPGMMGGMRGGPMGGEVPGPGMMDRGMTGGGMMGMDGMSMGPMMRGPHGQMGGPALGPGAIYGMPQGAPVEMTPARVEVFLSHLLERHGNPRLRIGEVVQAEDGSIIAEIVTVDGSLVQRLAFNRYPGLFRQVD